MRKVIGIGETVLDIIFKEGQPVSAVPGGSAFNAIISLGRCGVNSTFISEAGNDRIGDCVINFLKDNGVNADNVNIFPDSKSPISLAFLDENNNADYIFYKDHPHDQLEFVYPEVNPDDIVIFGSFFAHVLSGPRGPDTAPDRFGGPCADYFSVKIIQLSCNAKFICAPPGRER
jgi:fructokinase